MSITDPLILAPDVEWIAVEILPHEIQRQLTWEPGDYALVRPRKRTAPKLVNARVVALVEEFRSKTTIVEAVIHYCDKHRTDPKSTLYEAFPILKQLIQAQLLIPPEKLGEHISTYKTGDWVIGVKILDCLQSLEDSEIYCVLWNERKAALKIACSSHSKVMLLREAEILQQIDGQISPAFIAKGEEDRNFPYVLIEWLEGISIDQAAEELRNVERSAILRLCIALLRTYEQLHDQEILHGDVHPRNILVCGETVKLIDFGLARKSDTLPVAVGGVHFFFAPEQAECLLANQKLPSTTELSEQYSLAVLIYQLIVGHYPIDFAVEQSGLLRQIVESPTLSFADWGLSPWPEVEILLQKALRKEPEERFESVSAFANALERSLAPGIPLILIPIISIQTYLKAFLESTKIDGPLLNTPWLLRTTSSVFGGASGIAYALYRIACLRSDPVLLATADLWATRAHQHQPMATEQTAYFSSGELYCVQAMIAHAFGNETLVSEAIHDFLDAATLTQSSYALLPGIAGTLHICTLLIESVGKRQDLLEKGNSLFELLWHRPAATFATRYLGMAHGWSGILYTTLRWCHVAEVPLPGQLQKYLEALVNQAQFFNNAQQWPWRTDKKGYLSGWCNGNAGFYYLWLQASHAQLDKRHIAFAEAAALHCREFPSPIHNLCCGLVGQIYVLLHFYQHTREPKWQQCALKLSQKLAMNNQKNQQYSLYQGNVGIALLAAELDFPEFAFLPFFAKDAAL